MKNNQWYRFNSTEQTSSYIRKGKPIETPVLDKIYFSDEVVDAFSLEIKNNVPFNQEFTAVPNYFFDYWGYILGMKAAYTWLRYVRHVYRAGFEIHKSLSDIAEFMGITKNSLKKYIAILEDYGFVAVFYKDINKSESIINTEVILKVRKNTPFLTPDLVEKLPPKLQSYHARDIADLQKTTSVSYEQLKGVNEQFGLNISRGQNLTPIDNTNKDDLPTGGQNLTPLNEAQVIHPGSNFEPGLGQNLTPKENTLSEYNPIINNKEIWEQMLTKIRTNVSGRSIDSFFATIKPYFEENCLVLSSTNSFALDWIQEKYGDLLKRIAHELEYRIQAIKYIVLEI